MAEKAEQSKNLLDELKDTLSGVKNKIENIFNDILKKLGLKEEQETQEVENKTKQELDELTTKLINTDFDKLKNNIIEENIEGKIDDEKTILGLLAKNNQDIKNWFNWILEKDNSGNYIIDDEDVRSWEIETVLLSLREISDNDGDKKGDLTEQELKEIGENTKKKMELCDKIIKSKELKNSNGEIIELTDDKKTKKIILKAYNDVLSENNGDISKITEEKIIDKLADKKE